MLSLSGLESRIVQSVAESVYRLRSPGSLSNNSFSFRDSRDIHEYTVWQIGCMSHGKSFNWSSTFVYVFMMYCLPPLLLAKGGRKGCLASHG